MRKKFLDQLATSFGGPYDKALSDYNKTLDEAQRKYDKLIAIPATHTLEAGRRSCSKRRPMRTKS